MKRKINNLLRVNDADGHWSLPAMAYHHSNFEDLTITHAVPVLAEHRPSDDGLAQDLRWRPAVAAVDSIQPDSPRRLLASSMIDIFIDLFTTHPFLNNI